MRKLRSAIIGCGKIATVHAQALKNIELTELVAVQSRTASKAEEFGTRFGVQPYTDIATMIKREQVEVVVICTPHPVHAAPAITAFEHGAHVLVEKPLAITLADCDAMIAAAASAKKKLGVVSQRRFYPPVERMKKAIDDGKIGQPMLGHVVMYGWRDEAYYKSDPWRGSWEKEGGGVLVNQAPHQLDVLQWLMGSEMDQLYGVWQNINHPYIEVEDTAVAIITFKSGAVANILVSNAQKPGIYGKVHIHGSNGASMGVQTDGGAMFIAGRSNILEPPVNDIWTIPGEENNLADYIKDDTALFNSINPVEYFLRLQQRDFLLSVLEDREPLVNGREGRKTAEIYTAIYRSKQEGGPVKWPL